MPRVRSAVEGAALDRARLISVLLTDIAYRDLPEDAALPPQLIWVASNEPSPSSGESDRPFAAACRVSDWRTAPPSNWGTGPVG